MDSTKIVETTIFQVRNAPNQGWLQNDYNLETEKGVRITATTVYCICAHARDVFCHVRSEGGSSYDNAFYIANSIYRKFLGAIP